MDRIRKGGRVRVYEKYEKNMEIITVIGVLFLEILPIALFLGFLSLIAFLYRRFWKS